MSARLRLIAGEGGAVVPPADSSVAPPASNTAPPTASQPASRCRQLLRRLGQGAAAQQRQADLGAVALPVDVRVQRRLAGLRQRQALHRIRRRLLLHRIGRALGAEAAVEIGLQQRLGVDDAGAHVEAVPAGRHARRRRDHAAEHVLHASRRAAWRRSPHWRGRGRPASRRRRLPQAPPHSSCPGPGATPLSGAVAR